jgi:hypothetical protein
VLALGGPDYAVPVQRFIEKEAGRPVRERIWRAIEERGR